MPRLAPFILAVGLFATGCATGPDNPSFPLSIADADDAMKEMKAEPKPLARPVVVVGGYLDLGIAAASVKSHLKDATGDDRFVSVNLFTCGDFDACRRRIVDAVQQAYPSDDPAWTSEVDVVGVSMGGLAARYAAAAPPPDAAQGSDGRRLRIARLFTLGTPHQGAPLANLPTFIKLQAQMRPGSAFLARLAETTAGAPYPVYPYVRLHDGWVGPANAAPAGVTPMWLPNRPLQDAHLGLSGDTRILADIARRLRCEQPFAHEQQAPLPGEGKDEDRG